MARLPAKWKTWIIENLLRGVPADTLHNSLTREGFSDALIRPLLSGHLPQSFTYSLDSAFFSTLTQPAFTRHPKKKITNHSTDSLQIYQLDNVFSLDECAQLCNQIKSHLRPSDISTAKSGFKQTFRTSSTCDLPQIDKAMSQLADKRILGLFGDEFGLGEPIQAQHYAPGQEFKAHTDYFEPATAEYRRFADGLGQRTWTCMVYLNAVAQGGETEFAHINRYFIPHPGRALLWNNLDDQGNVNPASLHQAHPVIKGEKTIITKWLRTRC